MQIMNEIILEISAFVIAAFCLADCLKNRRRLYVPVPGGWMAKFADQHFVYLSLLVTLMISSISSVVEVGMENFMLYKSATVLEIANAFYFVAHCVLPALSCLYLVNITGASSKKGNGYFAVLLAPAALLELLVITNPFTGLIYYIDDSPAYVRGNLLWFVYVISLVYIAAGIVFLIYNVRHLSKLNRLGTVVLVSVSVLGILIQAFFLIPVELFFEAIALFGFMLLLEDETYRQKTGHNARMTARFIIVIIMIFLAIVFINTNIIYSSGSDINDRTGDMQTDNLKGELQQILSESESAVLRYAMNLEGMINDRVDIGSLTEYISSQKDQYMESSGGNCFSVYAASPEWVIIPGFDYPDDYIATERVWYTGAVASPGQVFISEPYIDAETFDLCYTFSYVLSDGKTVVAMDYTLSKVQDIVKRMSGPADQFALIVTDAGTIVGCSDENLQGEMLQEKLPDYEEIFDRVKASNEHKSFDVTVDGVRKIIFAGETSNGWKMIIAADYSSFYSQVYSQMVMLGAIDLLMLMVIIVFFMVSISNQRKAEISLSSTEGFIESLGDDLRDPLNDILRISDMYSDSDETREAIRSIRESGNRLREKLDNLFSYSRLLKYDDTRDIAASTKEQGARFESSRRMRNGVCVILIGALVTGLVMCMVVTTRWGESRIGREADSYNEEIAVWMQQKETVIRLFADVISADPDILTDYDRAVKWLDDVAGNYSEITFAYMADPGNKEHPVTMNNGWVPPEGFVVEERQWYKDCIRSKSGFSVSAPYFDQQTGLYCITFSKTVYTKDGQFLGVFATDCLLDKLIDVLSDSYETDSYAFMVDRDGTIINHPDKGYELSENNSVNIEDTAYADVYHNGSVFWMRDYDGRIVAAHAENSSLSGFTVIVVRSWWSIYGAVFIMTSVFLLMIAVSIVAIVSLINRFITWQEKTNRQLMEAVDTAVSAEKAKSRFLAQMSHEIRTPINAVLGMNEMILRESSDDGIREYAGNIRLAGRNLLGLINSILDFSKIEEGRMEIIPVRYDTATLIEQVVSSVSGRASDKGLEFNVHIDDSLPAALYGDDMRISQIITNLLTNAVKYTPKGSVDLFMDGTVKGDTLALSVRVRDTGIGIRQEDIGRLSESFTRLEETRNRNIEGTGLGMSIVNRLLEMMGSRLVIHSVYGEGSEFSFVLDQTIVDASAVGDYETKAKEAADTDKEDMCLYAPEARILVVDDHKMNLTVMKSLLKINGITPDLAHSGAEALEMLKDGRYDIVMLDHMMPEMDGIQTLQKANEEGLIPEKCTVIALTANAVVGAREEYLGEGFSDYLSKPVEVRALEEMLEKHLPPELVSRRKRVRPKKK